MNYEDFICQTCGSFDIKGMEETTICYRCSKHRGDDLGVADPYTTIKSCEMYEKIIPVEEAEYKDELQVIPDRKVRWRHA